MLSLARHIGEANVTMRQGKWLKKQYSGIELAGKTLGLIGFGRIAKLLAQKCIALGMNIEFIATHDHGIDSDTCRQVDKACLLEESDFISIHVPFAGGKPMIGEEEIKRMKDGVYIINCARGGVIDEDALVDAIRSGKVAGAALDVFVNEPFDNDRIAECERISMTPHIGAATKEAQERIGDEIVDIIKEKF
ncbi:MAG: hypothetical protein GX924_04310 [Clostridiaceae bacterium]|nr:hypothetical protein [Clostridiaceae bacterium]